MMTNTMIILANQIQLQEEGLLKFTGNTTVVYDAEGNEREIEEIQPIHTYNGWKARGYRVKKGEKAIAKFPIWKYTTKKKSVADSDAESEPVNEEEAQKKGFCFMKMSAFFTDEQVEKIEK